MKRSLPITIALLLFSIAGWAQIDLAPTLIFPVTYLPPGNHQFDIMMKNAGSTAVQMNTYKIGWQVNNAAATEVLPTTPQYGLFAGQVVRVTGNFVASFPTPGTYKLKVWTRPVALTDINHANDTIVQTIRVIANLPKKNVLMEVFKHQGCCPCFDAAVFEDTAVALETNYSVANIYCGIGDVIYNTEGDVINDVFDLAHPNVFFDRFLFPYAYTLERGFYTLDDVYMLTDFKERDRYYEPVEVSFSSASFNSATRLLKVKLKATFYDTVSGDYRFNLYVTEDSIKAFQECAVPDPNNYYHRNVLRSMVGGTWGQAGSLPATSYPGQQKFYEFSYTVPAGYVTSKLSLIGLVQHFDADSSQCRVMNSVKISFNKSLTLDVPELAGEETLHVYPNPVTDKVHVSIDHFNSTQPTEAYIVEVSGRIIRRISLTKADTEIDLTNLSSGIYHLQVNRDGAGKTFRIIKR